MSFSLSSADKNYDYFRIMYLPLEFSPIVFAMKIWSPGCIILKYFEIFKPTGFTLVLQNMKNLGVMFSKAFRLTVQFYIPSQLLLPLARIERLFDTLCFALLGRRESQ